jgi:hypothetical protein
MKIIQRISQKLLSRLQRIEDKEEEIEGMMNSFSMKMKKIWKRKK